VQSNNLTATLRKNIMTSVTEDQLKAALGKHIREFCHCGFTSDSENHCAHFVSHMLGFEFGATCLMMGSKKGDPANIRVQEIFPRCGKVGTWGTLPTPYLWGLAFIGNAGNVNVEAKRMAAVPRLHIGIFYGGGRSIYHYSNLQHKVVVQTPDDFSTHYPTPDNAMFWGIPP
jgi:hypothetical protein